jgi:orotidine-5'-phosphate decarboxylase
MDSTKFSEKLAAATASNDSLVCVGLDPVPSRLPESLRDGPDPVLAFNRRIIDCTSDLVCAYKPNLAFYGALGLAGWEALKATIDHVPDGIPVVADAKAGDIGSSAERYAVMLFEEFGADAVTANPYMGRDAMEPFLAYRDKGTFLLCLTSNPGASDIMKQLLPGGRMVFEEVASKAAQWNEFGNCGLVVGATQAGAMQTIRALAPELPILVPGVGAQGGDVETAVRSGARPDGTGLLVNASRSILYASAGEDFASAARGAAAALRAEINQYRPRPVGA